MPYFEYAICYPDREAIEFPKILASAKKVAQLVENFNWEQELKKEITYYSPSLDFVNVYDKHRFILSGMGEGKLEEFMVMFLIPNDPNVIEAFDEKNYYNSPSYAAAFTVAKGKDLLHSFLKGNYRIIAKTISRQEITIDSQHNPSDVSYNTQNRTVYQTEGPIFPPYKEKEEKDSVYIEVFTIIMGFAFCLLFFVLTILSLRDFSPTPLYFTFLLAGLSLFFGVGAVRYEKKLRKR